MPKTATSDSLAFCNECATSWDPKDPEASHEEWCPRKGKAPESAPKKAKKTNLDDALAEIEDSFGPPPATVDGEEAQLVLDGPLIVLTLGEALANYRAAEARYEKAHAAFTAAKAANKMAEDALENAKLDIIEAVDRQLQPQLNLDSAS